MKEIITKKEAEERAHEFWEKFLNGDTEALCFDDGGLQWQIRFYKDDDDLETLIISVEGYSVGHDEWTTVNDVAEIIYEFVNR